MPQTRRRSSNESVFREVNERIVALNLDLRQETIAIVCECATLGCAAPLELTVQSYESVRAEPTRFIVAPGHTDPSLERVIADETTYLVVEKLGEAADEARATDPRA